MTIRMTIRTTLAALVLLAAPLGAARAHCDTLDGPVVEAARTALESGKLNPVLAWVRPADEAEVKAAFARAAVVRKLGPEARALADRSFFETVVRVHRAGEGAPYTGLKAAGQDLGPAVPAADRAIAQRSPAEVEQLLVAAVRRGLHERLERVTARPQPGDDVAKGRAWVEAYVPYVHWVEGVYQAATGGGDGHAGAHAEPHPAAGGEPHAPPAPPPAHEHGRH